MGLYNALTHLQIRSPSKLLAELERRQAVPAPPPEATPAPPATGLPLKPSTVGRRLGKFAARRVVTAGHLTSVFGATWNDRGLVSAGEAVAGELLHFVRHRVKGALRTGRRPADPAPIGPPKAVAPAVREATLLIGYIDAQLGLGQSLRGMALAMSQSATPFSIYPFGVGVEGRRAAAYMPERYDTVNAYAVNVIEVGTDELPTVFSHISSDHFSRSYNILRTYWELSRAPAAWRAHLEDIDEIWAPNEFVAESFRTIFDRQITVIPPCLDLPDHPEVLSDGHKHFGLDRQRFHFLFSFDYFSFPQRKNPFAVLRAFRDAFPDPAAQVGLIIKSTGSVDHFPDIKNALRVAAQDDARIQIIDESLTRQEIVSLLAAADCYASLHRSEGFGFGLCEAMALGKPVIGTDYSGNTEFLRADTGYPVPYTLKSIAPDEYIYPDGQVWADPDEAACSAAMRHVFEHREDALRRAAAGQRFVRGRYSPANVGRIVEHRLTDIRSSGRTSRARPSATIELGHDTPDNDAAAPPRRFAEQGADTAGGRDVSVADGTAGR